MAGQMEPNDIVDNNSEVRYLLAVTGYKSPLIEDYIDDIDEEAEKAFGNRVFSLLEDKRIQEEVTDLTQIAEGSYGKIFARNNKAYKRISLIVDDYYDPSAALREIFVLRNLAHNNVMSMMSFSLDENSVYIAFERAVSDLATLLYAGKVGFTEEEWTKTYINDKQSDDRLNPSLMIDLIEGLNYIHSNGFLHRDIKPANLLIMSDGRLCICDFGCASDCNYSVMETIILVGTHRYIDISILSQGYKVTYDTFSDLWSAACVILEIALLLPLVTKTPLEVCVTSARQGFNRFAPLIEQLISVLSRENPLMCIYNDTLRTLLLTMLSLDKKKRITAPEILKSLNEINDL